MFCKSQHLMQKTKTFDCSPSNIEAVIKAARREQFNELKFDFQKKVRKVEKFGQGDIPAQLKEYDLLIRQEYEKIEDNWIAESWILNNHPDLEEKAPKGTQKLIKFTEPFARAFRWDPDIVLAGIKEFVYSYRMIRALEGWKEKIAESKPRDIEEYENILFGGDIFTANKVVQLFNEGGFLDERENWTAKLNLLRIAFFILNDEGKGVFHNPGRNYSYRAKTFFNRFGVKTSERSSPDKILIKQCQPNHCPSDETEQYIDIKLLLTPVLQKNLIVPGTKE